MPIYHSDIYKDRRSARSSPLAIVHLRPIHLPPIISWLSPPHFKSSPMQRPTCTGIRVRSPSDAHIIFHAVSLNLLPIVSRRLDTEERRAISTGCVYVWEERGPNAEATGVSIESITFLLFSRMCTNNDRFVKLGIERWTDSIRWGPSRVRDVSGRPSHFRRGSRRFRLINVYRNFSSITRKSLSILVIWKWDPIQTPRTPYILFMDDSRLVLMIVYSDRHPFHTPVAIIRAISEATLSSKLTPSSWKPQGDGESGTSVSLTFSLPSPHV